MIVLLGLLAKLSILIGFIGVIFASVSDLVMKTGYMSMLDNTVNLESPKVKIVLILVSFIYLVIFFLSYLNRMTKYSQNRKVKNKSGEIEVTIKTINEVAKDFLTSQEIIKNSKIKSFPRGKAVVIEAIVDTYNVDNLNERLIKIQEEMAEFVYNSTGINVKKSKVKLKKVLGETIVEKKIIHDSGSDSNKPKIEEKVAIAETVEPNSYEIPEKTGDIMENQIQQEGEKM